LIPEVRPTSRTWDKNPAGLQKFNVSADIERPLLVSGELIAAHRPVLSEQSAASGPNLRKFACGIAGRPT
jgi:hypothetical protein